MNVDAQKLPEKCGDALRVLHTADWHLGKMLGDLARVDEHRHFLKWLLGVIESEQIDVLVIAGDVFDTANPPQSADRMYFEFLAQVYEKTKCSVVVTGGNHDSPAHLEAPQQVLRTLNVHVTGALPERIEDLLVVLPSEADPRLVIAAVPFLRDRDLRKGTFGQSTDEIREELREGIETVYRRATDACAHYLSEGAALLAAGHLTVAGARVSESERDVHVGGLGKVDHKVFPDEIDYVALGHLHRPQSMSSEAIRYSGSPIPLSFSECEDVKEVRVLDFEEGQLTVNHGLVIPAQRRLAQLKTSRVELEKALAEFGPPKGELPTWVEVSVETEDAGENLFELVRSLTEARAEAFEVVRVQARRQRVAQSLSEADAADFRDVDDLLDSPCEVFERRLMMAGELSDEKTKSLQAAFGELYQIYLDEGKEDEQDGVAEEFPVGEIAEKTEEALFDFGDERGAKPE